MTVTLSTVFAEYGQETRWRDRVARDLNVLLGRAKYFEETSNDASDREVLRATLNIVERVATFEEIEVAG